MPTLSILDVGCGGGDVARYILSLANQEGFTPQVTGIDPDPRAIQFAQRQPAIADLKFRQCSTRDLLAQNQQFDIVISNHVLHHLERDELHHFAQESQQLSGQLVLFNDILRHDMAYLLFQLYTLGRFRDSFIREDGLTSIRRSYIPSELNDILGPSWDVYAYFPFRLIAAYKPLSA
jgi:2-polyprenyl-3-methyl-5-hydroxy-6-metoxy-1,4-benzoquinol methylase